jgi:hypothetical protein
LEIPPFESAVDILLEIHATPFVTPSGYQTVTLCYEKTPVCTWVMVKRGRYLALLPARPQPTASKACLTFRIAEPCSPASRGLSDDGRTLGLLLHSLSATIF